MASLIKNTMNAGSRCVIHLNSTLSKRSISRMLQLLSRLYRFTYFGWSIMDPTQPTWNEMRWSSIIESCITYSRDRTRCRLSGMVLIHLHNTIGYTNATSKGLACDISCMMRRTNCTVCVNDAHTSCTSPSYQLIAKIDDGLKKNILMISIIYTDNS